MFIGNHGRCYIRTLSQDLNHTSFKSSLGWRHGSVMLWYHNWCNGSLGFYVACDANATCCAGVTSQVMSLDSISALLLLLSSVFILTSFWLFRTYGWSARTEYRRAGTILDATLASYARHLKDYTSKLDVLTKQVTETQSTLTDLKQQSTQVKTLYDQVHQQVGNLAEDLVNMNKKLETIEEKRTGLVPALTKTALTPTSSLRADASLESPLSSLTPTEIQTLHLIATHNTIHGSELGSMLNKSREHTARLLKKLFEEGFLERQTNRIPFSYRLNEKIRQLIKEWPPCISTRNFFSWKASNRKRESLKYSTTLLAMSQSNPPRLENSYTGNDGGCVLSFSYNAWLRGTNVVILH